MRRLPLSLLSLLLCLAACRPSQSELSLEGRPIGEILKDLNSTDELRKNRALDQLRRSGTNAFPTLVALLESKAGAVPGPTKTPNNLAPHSLPSLADTLPATRRSYAVGAFSALGTNASAALPLLLPVLASPENAPVASMAMVRLGPDGVTAVVQAVSSDQPRIRAAASSAILSLRPSDAPALPVLLNALGSTNAPTIIAAAGALGKIGADADRVVPALLRLLDHATTDVRIGAITGLRDFGPLAAPATPELLKTVRSSEEVVRVASATALWGIAPEVARREGIENPLTGSGDSSSRSKAGK